MKPNIRALFKRLRRDRVSGRWEAGTLGAAPHKPLLLLALINGVECGIVTGNELATSGPVFEEVADVFLHGWQIVEPKRAMNLLLPFWHLSSDGVWELLDPAGNAIDIRRVRRPSGWTGLQAVCRGARWSDELCTALADPIEREALRTLLLETYFEPTVATHLGERLSLLRAEVDVSDLLIRQARRGELRRPEEAELILQGRPVPVRCEGFRRAVRTAYEHRCALCGIRLRAYGQRVLVEGAHIVPWRDTHDDRPTNGLALCPTCHWCFDAHLLGVDPTLRIQTSKRVGGSDNLPSFVGALVGRHAMLPTEECLRPDAVCVARRWDLFRAA